MKLKTILHMLLVASLASSPCFAGVDEGLAAAKKGDLATAIRNLKPLAEQGDARAQYSLGWMYENGQGVPQDYKEAVDWYHKAAEQGAVSAQYNLGGMYKNGRGVPQDYKAAVDWYRKAAEQGLADAQSNLGTLYERGKGVPQDYKAAVDWYRKAAEQGNSGAQNNLGVKYVYGHGVPKMKVVAYALFNLSADVSPSDDATESRTKVANTMTNREIEAGQTLTREMVIPGNFLKALDQYVMHHHG